MAPVPIGHIRTVLFSEPFLLLVFLPLTLAAFWGAGRLWGREAALGVVLVASLLFYASYGLRVFAVMAAGTLVNYAACLVLVRTAPERKRLRAGVFWAGQAWNFGSLALFKYLAPVVLGEHSAIVAMGIPVGISFYTFQQAVLLVDAFARRPEVVAWLPPPKPGLAFLRFGAFHTFFPALVVGPITYLSEFAPQALRRRFGRFRRIDVEVGLALIVIGLFKKVVIADGLAYPTSVGFMAASTGEAMGAAQAWITLTGYFVQLYFDFSGYSDMALGIARLFGIRLPINFDSPLRATGIVDFYRRWHITLTRVIARFLFTPLSLWGTRTAMRRKLGRTPTRLLAAWLPMMVNFQVIALWHAALPTFVVFGLVHGAWFAAETEVRASKAWRAWKARTSETLRRRLGQAFTILPLMLTFALFRSESLEAFGNLARALVAVDGIGPVDRRTGLLVAAAFAIVWLAPNPYELLRRYRPGIVTWKNPTTTPALFRLEWRPTLPWGLLLAAMALIAFRYVNQSAPFIYMGF